LEKNVYKLIKDCQKKVKEVIKQTISDTDDKLNFSKLKKEFITLENLVMESSEIKDGEIIEIKKIEYKITLADMQNKLVSLLSRLGKFLDDLKMKPVEYPYEYHDSGCATCGRIVPDLNHWRTQCTFCYAKRKGKLVNCSLCSKRTYVLRGHSSYCLDCYVKNYGISKSCMNCKRIFKTPEKSFYQSNMCQPCDLDKNGINVTCNGCYDEMRILDRDSYWRKHCYNCWLCK
jgi:hypothetical protein